MAELVDGDLAEERGGVLAVHEVQLSHLVTESATADAGIVHLASAQEAPGAVCLGADQTNGRMPFVFGLVVHFPDRMTGVAPGGALLEIGSADGAPTFRSALYRNDVEDRRFGCPIP